LFWICNIHFLKLSIFSNFFSLNNSFILTRLCFKIFHDPIVKCQTSEFPICPSGIQTAKPEASSSVVKEENKESKTGVSAL
jgi:hypothetical protein